MRRQIEVWPDYSPAARILLLKLAEEDTPQINALLEDPETLEALRVLRRSYLMALLKALQTEVVDAQRWEDKDRMVRVLYEKQAITKKILALDGQVA